MSFEFLNPVYYVGDKPEPLDSPEFLAGVETLLDELISQSLASGGTVSRIVSFTGQTGVPGQVLAETAEILIEADGQENAIMVAG